MRAGGSIVKKGLVVSLMAIYLLIAVTYILYLPKYNPLRPSANYIRVNSALVIKPPRHMHSNASGIVVLVHQAYRTTIENKKAVFTGIPQAALAVIMLLVGSIAAMYLLRTPVGILKPSYHHQRTYLSYCILRI